MATKLYLRSRSRADSGIGGRYVPFVGMTSLAGTSTYWETDWLSTTAGSLGQSRTVTTVTGPTSGVEFTGLATGWLGWVSPPLSADVTISGTITCNLRGSESSMSANTTLGARIGYISATTGAFTEIVKGTYGTEIGTSETVCNFNLSPTSTTVHRGDRICIFPYADDYSGGNMGNGYTITFYHEGASGASGDSYVTFNETFSFESDPAGTTVYPTTTSAGINPGSATEYEAWTSRGGGVTTSITNTATGPSSGIQATASAGGTAIEWYTKPLQAVTLSGAVGVYVRAKTSSTNAYAGVRCEVAVCNGDGSSATVYGTTLVGTNTTNNKYIDLTTSEATASYWVSGDDISITNGQRIRIRFYLDDAPGTNTWMVTGHNVTIYYAGAAGATGDTYLTFPITLSEYTPGTTVNAGVATATGSASTSSESIAQTVGSASATGAAYGATGRPGAVVNAGVATATASASTSSESVKQSAGVGTSTGVAYVTSQSISQTAGYATSTGAGLNASASVSSTTFAYPGVASGSGSALGSSESVGQSAGVATGTGAATNASFSPTVSATAGIATGTGVAEWGGGGGTTTVAQDSFTESSNTALASHTPETGTSWTADYTDVAGGLTVIASTDRVASPVPPDMSGQGGGGIYVVSPDITGEVDVYLTSDDAYLSGPVARRVSSTTHYRVEALDTAVNLYRRTSGADTIVASTAKSAGATKFRLNTSGSSPTALKVKAWASAGSEPGSWGIDTTDSTGTNQNATGKVGIDVWSYDDSEGLVGAATADDFLATTPGGGGSAVGPSVSIGQSAGSASATGAASTSSESISQTAGVATSTGLGYNATAETGSATNANAGAATATGSAYGASISIGQTASVATGTALAYGSSVSIGQSSGVATATGAARQPSESIGQTAGLAQASGSALDATAQVSAAGTAYPSVATSTGTAYGAAPSIGQTTTTATGTGAAYGASVSIGQFVGIATASAQSYGATVTTVSSGTATAGLAEATGSAYGATITAVSAAVETGGVGKIKPTWYGPMVRERESVSANAGVAMALAAAHGATPDIFMDEAKFLLGLTDEALILGVC